MLFNHTLMHLMQNHLNTEGTLMSKTNFTSGCLATTVGGLRDLKKVSLGPVYFQKDGTESGQSNHIYYAIDHIYAYSLGIKAEMDTATRKANLLSVCNSSQIGMLLNKKDTAAILSISISKLDVLTRENAIAQFKYNRAKNSPVRYHILSIIDYIVNLEYTQTV